MMKAEALAVTTTTTTAATTAAEGRLAAVPRRSRLKRVAEGAMVKAAQRSLRKAALWQSARVALLSKCRSASCPTSTRSWLRFQGTRWCSPSWTRRQTALTIGVAPPAQTGGSRRSLTRRRLRRLTSRRRRRRRRRAAGVQRQARRAPCSLDLWPAARQRLPRQSLRRTERRRSRRRRIARASERVSRSGRRSTANGRSTCRT
mmetsp:Transcript_18694/g.72126  ORF Transcript_18694/g.72126 Transcript_18694/m.72126 type:complete len:203 (+) Transcript_18694:348-956(+)